MNVSDEASIIPQILTTLVTTVAGFEDSSNYNGGDNNNSDNGNGNGASSSKNASVYFFFFIPAFIIVAFAAMIIAYKYLKKRRKVRASQRRFSIKIRRGAKVHPEMESAAAQSRNAVVQIKNPHDEELVDESPTILDMFRSETQSFVLETAKDS